MAVTTDAMKMLELIRAGVKFREKFTNQQKKLVDRFVGNFYQEGKKTEPAPENMLLGFQASILPQLAFDNPSVQVKAQRPTTGREIAQWVAQATNQWIKLRDIVDDLERVAIDSLYSFGILKVGIEPWHRHTPEPGQDEVSQRMERHMPFLTHVPNTDYVFDPECKKWEYRRWEGMRLVRDLEDVQADESYDEAARMEVTATYDPKADKGRTVALEGGTEQQNRVELWEVYLNETNEIGVLCEAGKAGAVWLRPLQQMKGPAGGPYVMVGGYYVPGSPVPASILALTADQFNELNAMAASAAKEEKGRKRFVVVNSDDPKVGAAVKRVENGGVLEIKGFDPRSCMNIEIGGTSAEKLNAITLLRDRLDRLMGQSDAIRGVANGGKTATEVSVAQDNASTRVQLLQRHFRRGVREALSKVAWYIFYDPAYVVRGAFMDEQGNEFEGYYIGGQQPNQQDQHWPDYNLSIEPMSMQRVDPQRQQAVAQMTLDVAMAVAPAIPAYPWIKWRNLLDSLGEAHHIEGFYDMVMDEQSLVQSMALGMTPPIPPSQPQSRGSVPANANPQLRAMFGGGMPMQMPMMGGGQQAGVPGTGGQAPAVPPGRTMGMMQGRGPMVPPAQPMGRQMAAVA